MIKVFSLETRVPLHISKSFHDKSRSTQNI